MQRCHHDEDGGTLWLNGYQMGDPPSWEEKEINQIITGIDVAQNQQQLASVMRTHTTEENVMNLNPVNSGLARSREEYGRNMINRLATGTHQAGEVCVGPKQCTQIDRESLPEGRNYENSINPDPMNFQVPGVMEEVINRNIPSETRTSNQEYGRHYIASDSGEMFHTLQGRQTNSNNTRGEAVQVNHVEEQCVTRRNTLSGRNPLCVEDKERPVFVNNYYAGDNPQQMFRELTQYKERGDMGDPLCNPKTPNKQDKVSKSSPNWNMGLTRMHRMEVGTRSPLGIYHPSQDPILVVQSNKDHELTASSVRSHRIPDYSVPPLTTHTYKAPPDDSLLPGQAVQMSVATMQDRNGQQTRLLETIKGVTSAVEQQVIFSSTGTEHTIIQSNSLFQEFIKSQNKRDLDPALMSIHTFTGEDSPQCLDWITRIKNVCVQSGWSLRQELINKAGIVVQNYLTSLDATLSENEMEEKILQNFSDIPTTTQAIEKLKSLKQGENESILAYNQRYKILAEQVEGRTISQVQSAVAMEMYLGTIIVPLGKTLKTTCSGIVNTLLEIWGRR